MSPFAALVVHEISDVAGQARALGRHAMRRAAIALVAALLALAGAGFVLSAAHVALARRLGPEGAGLILGAVLLVCAAVLVLYARRKRQVREPAVDRPEPPTASIAVGELAPLAAFVAAFVLARQLRRPRAP